MGLLEIDRGRGLVQPQYTPPELLGEHLSMPNARIIVVTASYCFLRTWPKMWRGPKLRKYFRADSLCGPRGCQLVEIQVLNLITIDYLRKVSTFVSVEVANSHSP